jgi:hypothetical protein
MIKEKYKQLCLSLQFGGISTMKYTHTLPPSVRNNSAIESKI